MAEFSTTKITPSDGVQIPSINGQVAGYQENDELKSYVLGTIPTDVSGHTADITGIRGTSLDYDPDSTTYIKGATCILNHIVYRAKQLIPSPAGSFDSSKWEEVSLHEIARKVATNTDAITSLISTYTDANAYTVTKVGTLMIIRKIIQVYNNTETLLTLPESYTDTSYCVQVTARGKYETSVAVMGWASDVNKVVAYAFNNSYSQVWLDVLCIGTKAST